MDPTANQTAATWVGVTVSAPSVDPLEIAATRAGLSVYWEHPAVGEAVAGFGALAVRAAARGKDAFAVLEGLTWPQLSPDQPAPPGPWFGGLAFDLLSSSAGWQGFGPARWWLPELLFWNREGKSHLTGFSLAGQDPRATAERLATGLAALAQTLPRSRHAVGPAEVKVRVCADRAAWDGLVEAALAAIASGSLAKVVTARAVEVTAPCAFDAIEVLARLRAYAPTCTSFLFASEDGEGAFVGATPETLCRVHNGVVESEALAGSAAPSAAEGWSRQDKERREHGPVAAAIVAGLAPLVESVEVAATPVILTLPNVKHLRTPVRGTLRQGVTAAQVVRALHPTPAVGGTPRERALAFLAEHEGLQRGWYAGVVGWIGPAAADLRVALRSALLRQNHAEVFVGAGIVAGSVAAAEWTETEAKSQAMLQALGVGDG